ncbi:hypothetical protein [Streptomyces cavernae]|uniref:hypothetical protein n=1 Tax=Streptomyces cavernae TaxID=2259034 RepID=UPI000FEB6872|nr:hypothetical protein [Streptomyces cavernae]
MVAVRVGIGTGSEVEGRYGIGTGLVAVVQACIGIRSAGEAGPSVDDIGLTGEAGPSVDGIGSGPVVDVQVGIGASFAVEAGRAVDGIGADSAEVTGRG